MKKKKKEFEKGSFGLVLFLFGVMAEVGKRVHGRVTFPGVNGPEVKEVTLGKDQGFSFLFSFVCFFGFVF